MEKSPKYLSFIIIGLCLLFAGCRSVTINTYCLSFGHYGGFTGAKSECIFMGNGKLYQLGEFSGDTILLKTIDKAETKRIFKMATSKDFMSCQLNSPGNMNYFIRFYKNGSLIKDLKWSKGVNTPDIVVELQSELGKIKP